MKRRRQRLRRQQATREPALTAWAACRSRAACWAARRRPRPEGTARSSSQTRAAPAQTGGGQQGRSIAKRARIPVFLCGSADPDQYTKPPLGWAASGRRAGGSAISAGSARRIATKGGSTHLWVVLVLEDGHRVFGALGDGGHDLQQQRAGRSITVSTGDPANANACLGQRGRVLKQAPSRGASQSHTRSARSPGAAPTLGLVIMPARSGSDITWEEGGRGGRAGVSNPPPRCRRIRGAHVCCCSAAERTSARPQHTRCQQHTQGPRHQGWEGAVEAGQTPGQTPVNAPCR